MDYSIDLTWLQHLHCHSTSSSKSSCLTLYQQHLQSPHSIHGHAFCTYNLGLWNGVVQDIRPRSKRDSRFCCILQHLCCTILISRRQIIAVWKFRQRQAVAHPKSPIADSPDQVASHVSSHVSSDNLCLDGDRGVVKLRSDCTMRNSQRCARLQLRSGHVLNYTGQSRVETSIFAVGSISRSSDIPY